MKTKSIMSIVCGLVALVSVVAGGCAAPQPRVAQEVYVPRFDYNPSTEAASGSAQVTFAVVSPQFSANASVAWLGPEGTTPVLVDFQNAMAADFQELLMAKGFTVRGPFDSYMAITFPDKKGSDLVLVPEIDVTIRDGGTSYDLHVGILGPNTFTFHGTAELGGRINLCLSESLSNEKMWIKSVNLPSKRVAWTGTERYLNPRNAQATTVVPPPLLMHFSDPGFATPVGRELEAYYMLTMESAWDYLNPEEMTLVKEQSQEIRTKKVY